MAKTLSPNTDVLGWIVERATGRPLRSFLADIVDAAGLEDRFFITTDRDGVPTLDGGGFMTARDLARYFSIFIRRGAGISEEQIGSASFIDQTMTSGVKRSQYGDMRYSNHMMVRDRWLGHGGWCGQYAMGHLDTGTVGVFFSVVEDAHEATLSYKRGIIQMLEAATGLP